MNIADVAIVGAGPYGLSISAYLRQRGLEVRTFGQPMDTWRNHMPMGMRLKSEGFASNLYAPDGKFTLSDFCRDAGIEYADQILPVGLDTFCSYGVAFAKALVPELDPRQVRRLTRARDAFELELDDGEKVCARRAIVAAGISHYGYVPPVFDGLPEGVVVHSSRYHDYSRFRGRSVAVIGAGASAVDVALSLHQAGASPQLVARTAKLAFHDPPQAKRSLANRILYPRSGLGCGLRSRMASDFPDVFARLPRRFRSYALRTHLGPAPCWFTKEELLRNVRTHLGVSIERVELRDGRVRLELASATAERTTLAVDAAVAATGYKVDLARLPFLDTELRSALRGYDGSPVLNRNFESTVPGLFFVGLTAGATFGPLLRFAYGARFTAERIRSSVVSGKRLANG